MGLFLISTGLTIAGALGYLFYRQQSQPPFELTPALMLMMVIFIIALMAILIIVKKRR